MIVVERLDNGDVSFACSVCEYREILAFSLSHYVFWEFFAGHAVLSALYHDSSHIRETT